MNNYAAEVANAIGPRSLAGLDQRTVSAPRADQDARQRDGGWPNVSAVWVRDLGEHWGALLPPR